MMSFFEGDCENLPVLRVDQSYSVKEENGNQTTAATLSMANIIKDNNTPSF